MNSVEGNKDIAVFKIRLLDVRICTSTKNANGSKMELVCM